MNWSDLISKNQEAVVNFAAGRLSARNFQKAFSGGKSNPVRSLVRSRGTNEARSLARKAVSRRGLV